MRPRIERLLIAITFALLAAGATLMIASAQSGTNVPTGQTSSNCAACHTDFVDTWQNGPHGKAGTDPVFLDDWKKQGKPGACLVCHTTGYDPATGISKENGVTCESCHGPAPTDHPKSPMPVNQGTEACTRCHSDTRFGVQDWKDSTHYRRGLECTSCHDPHSASIKDVPAPLGSPKSDKVSQLCITCHKDSNMDFSLTVHAQKNISCADCHVKDDKNLEGAPHQVPDHSFSASLTSCNTCHAQQMHSPGSATNTKDGSASISVKPTPPVALGSIVPQPDAISPVGFSLIASIIGLAGGMVLAPWLERWYRRIVKQSHEDQDDQAKD